MLPDCFRFLVLFSGFIFGVGLDFLPFAAVAGFIWIDGRLDLVPVFEPSDVFTNRHLPELVDRLAESESEPVQAQLVGWEFFGIASGRGTMSNTSFITSVSSPMLTLSSAFLFSGDGVKAGSPVSGS